MRSLDARDRAEPAVPDEIAWVVTLLRSVAYRGSIDERTVLCHRPRPVPPRVPARRGRGAVAAAAGRHDAGVRPRPRPARPPRRMVAIQTNLGILPQFFSPRARQGLQAVALPGHPEGLPPGTDGLQRRVAPRRGRRAPGREVVPDRRPAPRQRGFKNSVSLDQVAAERIGAVTRFPVLVTRVGIENGSLSYTRGGVEIPPRAERGRPVPPDVRPGHGQGGRRPPRRPPERQSVLDFVNDSAKTTAEGPGRRRTATGSTSTSPASATWRTSSRSPQEWEKKPKPVVEGARAEGRPERASWRPPAG